MKKLISILVILTMLVPLCLWSVPASAAGGDLTLPVATWAKPWEANPSEWHAISSYDELLSYFTKADTVAQQKNLYLVNDIDIPAKRFYAKDGNVEITSENFVLDGNGYTFKYTENSAAVFFKMNNAVIRNLKLTGDMVADGDGRSGGPAYSPLGDGWQYNGKVTIDNVASNVNVALKNQDGYVKNAAGVIAVVGEGSYLSNVKYTGTVAAVYATKNDIITGIAGIAGLVRGAATFENCTTVGATLSIPANCKGVGAATTNAADIGMIVAFAEKAVTLKNCSANGTVSFSGETYKNGDKHAPIFIGGLIGRVTTKATITDSINTATVVVDKASANEVSTIHVGGFVGVVDRNAEIYMTRCNNNAPVIAQDAIAYIGGFVGELRYAKVSEFLNCTNGRNGTVNRSQEDANAGIAGFVGFALGENVVGVKVKFEGCVNNADIMTVAINKKTVNGGAMIGGFVGESRCVADLEFKNCINNGDVMTSDKDSVKNYQGSGGFVGVQRVAGFDWAKNVKTLTAKFTNCVNTGNIKNVHSAGGIVGRSIEMQKPDDTYSYTMTLDNCVNMGDITAPQAGGIYGAANDDSNYACLVDMTFNKCLNGGKISGGDKADSAFLGGIIGDARQGTILITNAVNGGEIGKGAASAGIIGNVGSDIEATVNDSYVLGSIDNTSKKLNPICTGEIKYNNSNYFDERIIDDWFDEAKEVPASEVDAKVDKIGVMAGYGFDRLADLITEVNALSANQGNYDATLWEAVQTALAAAKTVVDAKPLTIAANGAVTLLDQKVVNKAYYDLYNARVALGDKVDHTGIEDAIKAAEKLKAEDYTEASWMTLQSALVSAKAALAGGNDEIIASATEFLNNAIKGLVEAPKAPVEDDNNGNEGEENKPNTENTEKPTEPAPTEPTDATTKKPAATDAEEGGCGSIMGGAAVVAVALVALGTGISFKKKD